MKYVVKQLICFILFISILSDDLLIVIDFHAFGVKFLKCELYHYKFIFLSNNNNQQCVKRCVHHQGTIVQKFLATG